MMDRLMNEAPLWGLILGVVLFYLCGLWDNYHYKPPEPESGQNSPINGPNEPEQREE